MDYYISIRQVQRHAKQDTNILTQIIKTKNEKQSRG